MRKGDTQGSSTTTMVGVGWYTQMQWDKLQSVAVDPKILEESYAQWVEVFIAGCSMLEKAGIKTVKIPIDVDELVQWCEQNGMALDAKARSRFVTEKLRKIKKI
jgi:hypothetical protein